MAAEGNAPVVTHPNEETADRYLRLYERQMAHYERTQEIEWKGSFGVWTLLAAGIAFAVRYPTAVPHDTWRSVLIAVVLVHAVWLSLIHQSEETDKELWARYRDRAEELLGHPISPSRSEWWRVLTSGLSWLLRRLLWLALEAGLTAGMAWLIWSITR
jgi:hypothetical protein